MATANPAMSEAVYLRAGRAESAPNVMTLQGSVIKTATGAIGLVYLVDIVASFFGRHLPYIHENGAVGIGFSLVVVVIAALNLVLDFDFIEQGVRQQASKYMEWYGGFSLLVTLVWMYLEILRLLAKLQSRRD